jgi:Zn-dependent protease
MIGQAQAPGSIAARVMTLSFRLGKIPVRVFPAFFLMTVLLGMGGTDLRVLVAWIAVVFASVLVHEMGHAGMGLAFGLEPRIDLHGMGGTTSWAVQRELSAGRRIAISLAGPFAGFTAAALVRFGLGPTAFPESFLGGVVYQQLLAVNFSWGVLNLLPMLPLDGGNVMAQALNALTRGRGERAARIVSIVVAALAIAAAARIQSWWGALLALSFIASNWRGLKDLSAREHDAPMKAALKLAQDALEAKDGARVLELARPVALGSRSAPVRAEALHLLAFGFLLESRVADADAAIAALPKGYSPHPSLLALRASLAGS